MQGITVPEVALGTSDLTAVAAKPPVRCSWASSRSVEMQPSSLAFPFFLLATSLACYQPWPQMLLQGRLWNEPSPLWYPHQPHREMLNYPLRNSWLLSSFTPSRDRSKSIAAIGSAHARS